MRLWRKVYSAIITSEKMAKLSDPAWRLYMLLLVAQDDEGKYPWTPTRIKALTVGTSWKTGDVQAALKQCVDAGVAVSRRGFIYVVGGIEKNGNPDARKEPYIYGDIAAAETEARRCLGGALAAPGQSLGAAETGHRVEQSKESRAEQSKEAASSQSLDAATTTSLSSPSTNNTKPSKGISPEFERTMVIEWADVSNADEIHQMIEEGLAHKASKKWTDTEKGVRAWLRRDLRPRRDRLKNRPGATRVELSHDRRFTGDEWKNV